MLYWLSALPILPLLREAIERFCCSSLLSSSRANQLGATGLPLASFGQALSAVNGTSFSQFTAQLVDRLGASKAVLNTSLSKLMGDQQQASGREAVTIDLKMITALPANTATDYLKTLGVGVQDVVPLDAPSERLSLRSMLNVALLPKVGDKVTLYTRNDKVAFFSAAPAPAAPASDQQLDTVAEVRKELAKSHAAQSEALSKRDAEISSLRAEIELLKKLMPKKPG